MGPNHTTRSVRSVRFGSREGWHKKLSIGVGAVKEFDCTDDASGMNDDASESLASISAVTNAGGVVNYPVHGRAVGLGRSKKCGEPRPRAHGIESRCSCLPSTDPIRTSR